MSQQQNEEKYPSSLTVILITQALEKFVYYGLRSGLWMFLNQNLDMPEENATQAFHLLLMLHTFSSFLGIFFNCGVPKFWVVFLLNILYISGAVMLLVFQYYPNDFGRGAFLGAYATIMFAAGAIRPCFINLAMNEFEYLKFSVKFSRFIIVSFVSMNVMALIAAIVLPYVRALPTCDICPHLPFIIATSAIVCSTFVFLFGQPYFKTDEPMPSNVKSILGCIFNARSNRKVNQKPNEHWINCADPAKYDPPTILRARIFMNVFWLFLAFPLFWALFEQSSSTWIYQAKHMNRHTDFVTFQPDHTQAIYPIVSLLLISFNEFIFYKILEAIDFDKPLHKVIMGMIVAVFAFIAAYYVQQALEEKSTPIPYGKEAHFRFFNGLKCDYMVNYQMEKSSQFPISHMKMVEVLDNKLDQDKGPIYFDIQPYHTPAGHTCPVYVGSSELKRGEATGFFLKWETTETLTLSRFDDNVRCSNNLAPKVRILVDNLEKLNITLKNVENERIYNSKEPGQQFAVPPGKYVVMQLDKPGSDVQILDEGGVYVMLILEKDVDHDFQSIIVTNPISMSIFYIIPQFVLITFAESLITPNWLSFLFDEAPKALKPTLEAVYYLMMFFGNLIVVVINEIGYVTLKWKFLIYFCLMIVNTIFISILVNRFKQIDFLDRTSIYMSQEAPRKIPKDRRQSTTTTTRRV